MTPAGALAAFATGKYTRIVVLPLGMTVGLNPAMPPWRTIPAINGNASA